MTAFPTVLAGVISLSLAGCGSSSESPSESTPSTAAAKQPESAQTSRPSRKSLCALLPKAEMETTLGGPLTSAESTDSPGKTQCTYVGFGRYADVAIEWGNGEAGMAGARLAAKFMGATAGAVPVMTPIADLGDEAVMMIGGVLSVRKGDDLITVDLRTQKNSEVVGPTIVRKIIEQL